jgi:chemosensory pili system protein ChpC
MSANPNIVSSLLIPLAGARMLIPQSGIAEVIRPGRLRELETEAPWLMGVFEWRAEQVPLVSLEGMCHGSRPREEPSRYVVLYGVEHIPGLSFYAIEAQGIPRSLKLEPSMVLDAETGVFDCDVAAQHVVAAGEPAFMPDLSVIERGIRAQLQRM